MNVNDFRILEDVFVGYDKTKTSVTGRVRKRTNPFHPFGGAEVIGPPPTRFVDCYADSATHFSAMALVTLTANNRMFVAQIPATGVCSVGCYELDPVELTWVYVGRLSIMLPNVASTTHTLRAIRVMDTGTTGWKLWISTTGSVLVNGGVTLANKVDRADFFPAGGQTIWHAQTDDIKGAYHVVRAYGQQNAQTASIGIGIDGTEIIQVSGTPAAFSTQGIDSTIAPTVESRTVTSSVSSPHFTLNGHGLVDGQQVIISNAGNTPTGFTNTPPGIAQVSVYFVRDALANTFNLAATFGGTAVAATSATTGIIVRRAWGQTIALDIPARAATYSATGITGTALNNAIQIETPTTGPTANVKSVFVFTATTIGLFPKASLSAGGLAPAGVSAVNVQGTGVDFNSWPLLAMAFDGTIQRVIQGTNFGIGAKPLISNITDGLIGAARTDWRDNLFNDQRAVPYTLQTTVLMEARSGIAAILANVAGQRGVILVPLGSDRIYGVDCLVSRVLDLGEASQLNELLTVLREAQKTDTLVLSYRTGLNAADAVFDSISGGWNLVSESSADVGRLSGVTARALQVKIEWTMRGQTGCAGQVSRLAVCSRPIGEPADEFVADVTNSIASAGVGGNRAAWQLRTPFAGTAVVPPLAAFAYDTADTLQASATTAINAAAFEYSADGGGAWLPWSNAIPNTAGILIRWALGASNSANWIVSLRKA